MDIFVCRIVSEEFLDEVDVGHHHATAAVAVESELSHGLTVGWFSNSVVCWYSSRRIPIVNVALDQLEVAFPEVTDDLEESVEALLVDFGIIPCHRRSNELE